MSSSNRLRMLDFLRATSIMAMIFYHFVYDLGDFGYINLITVINGYWKLFAQSIGCSFLFLSGISFWVMASRGINWLKYFKRLAILTASALLISIVTYAQFGSAFIFFGILHLLATCSIFALMIYRVPIILLIVLGLGLMFLPNFYFDSAYYNDSLFSNKYLAWTGLYNGRTGSVDFYAFMPWSAAFIFGLAIGKIFIKSNYLNNLTPLTFKEEKKGVFVSMMLWAGRNSLLVYLIHQPILYALIYSFKLIFW